MNAATRLELDAIAIPLDEHGPVRVMAIIRNGQWRTAWGHDGGRRPEPFEAVYTTAKDAAAASRYLNARSGAGVA